MENESRKSSLLKEIAKVCSGLTYISEIDAGFEVFGIDRDIDVNPSNIHEVLEINNKEPVEAIAFNDLFKRLTRKREWHGQTERTRAKRFANLRDILKRDLNDLKVFRVGRVSIDIYILGRSEDGSLIGVKTKSVET